MSNFVTVDNGKTIINLEQVACIKAIFNEAGKAVKVTFAVAPVLTIESPSWVILTDDEAERFLTAVMRQTATW